MELLVSLAMKEAARVHLLPSLAQQKKKEQEQPRDKFIDKRQSTHELQKRKSKRRTVTMTFQSSGESSNLPPASWEKVNAMCPSVQDALDR
ncbi:Putative calcium-binding protein CML13, partial [Durusdinium trenchii]